MERREIIAADIDRGTEQGHGLDNPHDVIQAFSWRRSIDNNVDNTQEMGAQIEIDEFQFFLSRQQDVVAGFYTQGM